MGNVFFANRYIIIYNFGLIILMGFIIALILLYYISNKKKLSDLNLFFYIPFIAIGTILFGKVFYIFSNFYLSYNNVDYNIFDYSDTSIYSLYNFFYSYYGFLFGIIFFTWICYRKSKKIYEVLDIAMILFSLLLFFGWFGLFDSNINYGKETTLPIGIVLQGLDLDVSDILVHPVQIYFAIFYFILFVYLFIRYIQRVLPGIIFYYFIIISSIGDFILTIYLEQCNILYNLCYSQYIDIFILLIAIFMYFKKYIYIKSI